MIREPPTLQFYPSRSRTNRATHLRVPKKRGRKRGVLFCFEELKSGWLPFGCWLDFVGGWLFRGQSEDPGIFDSGYSMSRR